jgi:hypothetical protein
MGHKSSKKLNSDKHKEMPIYQRDVMNFSHE